ncbi:MAG TPA: hypothetical protein DEA52_02790 [Clostridiaceae bacterium]|nr:hypothetical protein [Clostridiaceae bacterium]
MEKESFEDTDVAAFLNEHFISIKVDKEERPDLNHVYMGFCQAMTGQGGWPMTLMLTEEEVPFFAATYLPKETKGETMGLLEILYRIHSLWQEERDKVKASASYALDVVSTSLQERREGVFTKDLYGNTFEALKNIFDDNYGGFYQGQKFPQTHHLFYLLRYYHRTKEEEALAMVEKSLLAMYKGGLFDHLGYGFSRYTVDPRWLVPHFEKMLSDNALLVRLYLEAYEVTRKPLYREVAKKTLTYLYEVMASPLGGFYTAEDADSEGEEGRFYTFTKEELLTLLGEKDGEGFAQYFGLREVGPFQGKNILHRFHHSITELYEDEPKELPKIREKVLQYREQRGRPFLDDKLLASCNGLMLEALCKSHHVLQGKENLKRAETVYDFLIEKMMDGQGFLAGAYGQKRGQHEAYVDGYAAVINGALSYYEETLETKVLDTAVSLATTMITQFYDRERKVFLMNGQRHEKPILDAEDIHDGSMASGHAEAVRAMGRLYSMTGKGCYKRILEEVLDTFAGEMKGNPLGFTGLLLSGPLYHEGPRELVLSGAKEDKEIQEMLAIVHDAYDPYRTVVLHDPKEKEAFGHLFSFHRPMDREKPTAYLCTHFTCSVPLTSLQLLQSHLEEL